MRAFVIWEPVLTIDWFPPAKYSMKRVSDHRARQYWDPGRLLSKAMGERDGDDVVWDWAGVYSPEAVWEGAPPKPFFADGPVVRVLPGLTDAANRVGKLP